MTITENWQKRFNVLNVLGNAEQEPFTSDMSFGAVKIDTAEVKERKREERIAAIKVPPRYIGARWENWRTVKPEMRNALLAVKSAWTRNVFMSGSPGTGKTYLAYCLAIDGARYKRFSDIGREIRSNFTREEETLEDLSYNKLLVIDEIGRCKASEFERNLLFEIIDRRYNAQKPTTLISNMSVEEFTHEYGAALMDRFRPTLALFLWESYRSELCV